MRLAELRKELAAHLFAVLINPRCPASIHNAITDALTEMAAAIDYKSPQIIERVIKASERKTVKSEAGQPPEYIN